MGIDNSFVCTVSTGGGPISMPDDAAYVLARCEGCHGFYGASSAERLPAETAIRDQIRNFKSLPNLKGIEK